MENLGARVEKACPIGDRVRAWLDLLWSTVVGCRTAILELIVDHATFKTSVDGIETLVEELHDDHAISKVAVDEGKTAIDDLVDRQAENKIAVDELIDDHAAFKTVVDELTAWAEALGTKLNSDSGVNDEDYDAEIASDAPDTLSAGDPTAITASKPTAGPETLTAPKPASGPATLTAGDPDAAPADLATYE